MQYCQVCSAWTHWVCLYTHNLLYECTAACALSSTVLVLAWSLKWPKMTSLRLLATPNDSNDSAPVCRLFAPVCFSTSYFPNCRVQGTRTSALTLSVASCRLTNGLLMCKKWETVRNTCNCLSGPCLRSYRWTCLGFSYLACSVNMKQTCVCLCRKTWCW